MNVSTRQDQITFDTEVRVPDLPDYIIIIRTSVHVAKRIVTMTGRGARVRDSTTGLDMILEKEDIEESTMASLFVNKVNALKGDRWAVR